MTENCECGCGRCARGESRYASHACRQRAYTSRLRLATGVSNYEEARRIRRSRREILPVERLLAELAAEDAECWDDGYPALHRRALRDDATALG